MNTERGNTSIGDLLTEVGDLVVGLGIMTMAVAPFAIPVLVLVLVPLVVVGLLGAVVAAIAAPPFLLVRFAVKRRPARPAGRAPAEIAQPVPAPTRPRAEPSSSPRAAFKSP